MNTQAYAGTMTVGTAMAEPAAQERAQAQEKVTAPGAVASVVWGVLGFFLFGVILGCVAIGKSSAAKKLIEAEPDRYTGGGLATTGMVLGVIDLIGAVFTLLMFMTK